MVYDGDPEWIRDYVYDKERHCDKNCKGCINVTVYYDSVNKQWMNVCCIFASRLIILLLQFQELLLLLRFHSVIFDHKYRRS